MEPTIKGLACPDQDIGRSAGAAERLIGQPALFSLRRGLIRDDYHEVVIAIRPSIASGLGAEQVDALRLKIFDQAADESRSKPDRQSPFAFPLSEGPIQ